jgi:hypothetical protein
MLPQVNLVCRLQAITPLTAITGANVFPGLVPGIKQYPAAVYQVLENRPESDADAGSNDYTMRIRVSLLGLSQTPAPYATAWAMANAAAGDAENRDDAGELAPTGLNGWKDPDGNLWYLEDEFDEAGEIMSGTDTYWAFVVNQIYKVQYRREP